jgi:hypothetical protein
MAKLACMFRPERPAHETSILSQLARVDDVKTSTVAEHNGQGEEHIIKQCYRER